METSSSASDAPFEFFSTEQDAGRRIDAILAERYPEMSRSKIQTSMRRGLVRVDGRLVKPSHRIAAGQLVVFTPPSPAPVGSLPEAIPLSILFEDDQIAAINKPAGMVVHPAKGHWQGTLTAALVHYFSQLSQAGGATRPGIIHRLDRDTSGVILIAKTDRAHSSITKQFSRRTVFKEYLAIVAPAPDRDRDWIDQPIGVHPYHRERMAIRSGHPTSRPAQTFFEVIERFQGFALVRLLPRTGRTHQLRVHLAAIQTPIVADRLYSGRSHLSWNDVVPASLQKSSSAVDDSSSSQVLIARQALHSFRLEVDHPISGRRLRFEAPLPDDFVAALDAIRAWRKIEA